ncbi:acetyl-CoA carboxylase carboxyl transferase subunit alpha, partial [Microbacteriaceae bacterium K1510]|nr:acetyl-CoA carboxylase carboxyl transferase subunit alpha [Microbacteriaceae bacterium K1510]
SEQIYGNLTPWQRVQLARHAERPTTLDLIQLIFTDFLEVHGDRLFGDDHAMVGGVAKLDGRPVTVLGHQKGKDTKE